MIMRKPFKLFLFRQNSHKGSILILSLWVLAMLSLFTLAVGSTVNQFVRGLQVIDNRDQLRWIAAAGARRAMGLLDQKPVEGVPRCDALSDPWGLDSAGVFKKIKVGNGFFSIGHGDDMFRAINDSDLDLEPNFYGLVDEESKININKFERAENLAILVNRVTAAGERVSGEIAASIIDWRDSDNHVTAGGAEKRYYSMRNPSYQAKDGAFDTYEELLYVKGITPEIYRQLLPYVTLYSRGYVNINTASSPVLEALGLPTDLVLKIITYRNNGGKFESAGGIVETLTGSVNLDEAESAALEQAVNAQNFSVWSTHWTIEGAAHLENRREWLYFRGVFQRYKGLRIWQERFGVGPKAVGSIGTS